MYSKGGPDEVYVNNMVKMGWVVESPILPAAIFKNPIIELK